VSCKRYLGVYIKENAFRDFSDLDYAGIWGKSFYEPIEHFKTLQLSDKYPVHNAY